MGELVSAIITTHNRSALLKRAIDSVLSQTYDNIECIVVNDNSTDNTEELCSNYKDIKYIYVPPKESHGGNYARNLGIKSSSGDYIAFLDDDDYWFPDKISKQMSIMKNSDSRILYCGRKNEIILDNGLVCYKDSLPSNNYRGDLSHKIFTNIPTTTSALLIERKTLEEAGCFDENLFFWQEFDLLIRLAQISEIDFVNAPLFVYRIDKNDKNRLTNRYKPWKESVKYILNKHKLLIKGLSVSDKLKFRQLIASDAYLRAQSSSCASDKFFTKINYYFSLLLGHIIKK